MGNNLKDLEQSCEMVEISIITPTFNGAKFIHKLWDSIKNQTFQDFEWIIIDDGSADNTNEVVKTMQDSRIIYHRFEKNRGPQVARNKAKRMAKGKFVIDIDSDDQFLRKDSLEMMYNEIKKTGDDIASVHFPCITTSGKNKSWMPSEEKFVLDYWDYLRGKVKGDFITIEKSYIAKGFKHDERVTAGSTRTMEILKEYNILVVDKPARLYVDDTGENLTSNKNFVKIAPKRVISITAKLEFAGNDIKKVSSKKYYGMIKDLLFWNSVIHYREPFRQFREISRRLSITEYGKILVYLIMPMSIRRFLLIKIMRRGG